MSRSKAARRRQALMNVGHGKQAAKHARRVQRERAAQAMRVMAGEV